MIGNSGIFSGLGIVQDFMTARSLPVKFKAEFTQALDNLTVFKP